MDCVTMFLNCNGLFININTSNSGHTTTVFDYSGTNYNHNLTVINSNFENVAGPIINSVSTIGFSNIVFIGLNIRTPGTSDYLFVLNNPVNLFIEIRDVPNDLTKCINIINSNTLSSFFINKNVPVTISGYAINTPSQTLVREGYMFKNKFSCMDAKFITACISPNEEEIAAAYTIRVSTGSYVKLTSGGSTIAVVNPFNDPITSINYFKPGTIITLHNTTESDISLSASGANYSFETSATLAAGETASFILQYNGTYYWHAI